MVILRENMYFPVIAMPLNSSTSAKLARKSFSENPGSAAVAAAMLFPDVVGGLHPRADHHEPHERHRDEDLPAQAHDLVVTVARERRTHPQEHRHDHEGLDAQPDPAGDEREEFEGRDPPAEEHDHGED